MGMILLTVIWGFAFIMTKSASEFYTASQMLFYRFLISSVVMLVLFHKDVRGADKKDMYHGVVLGVFLCLGFFCQTSAIYYTTVSKNAFLTTLNVIFVPMIAAFVHKKKIDAYSIAGCILALVGTGVMSLETDFTINFGDFLSIMCAVFFSFHVFFQSEFAPQTKTTVLATVQIVFAGILCLIFSLITGGIKITVYEPKAIAGILYLAVMSTCVSFLLQSYCQKYTSAVKAVVIFSLEAVFASGFAVIIFRDAVTTRFLIGSSMIFTAVIISSTKLVFLRVLTNGRQ